MIARLFKLCMACALLASLLPMGSAIASRPHRAHAACCLIGVSGDGLCADHGCCACAVDADVALEAIAPAATGTPPITAEAAPLADHRATFDPPPPRPVG